MGIRASTVNIPTTVDTALELARDSYRGRRCGRYIPYRNDAERPVGALQSHERGMWRGALP